MHSFDNGTSITKRQDNWAQLEKLFIRKNFPISRTAIDNVIHCQPDSAIPLITQLYTLLTSKSVQKAPELNEDDYTPPFARATAAKKIKDRLKETDLLVNSDEAAITRAADQVLANHQDAILQEKVNEPQRFLPPSATSRTAPGHLRVAPRKVGQSEFAGATIQFPKKVHVKQLDESVAQLRAAHSQGLSGQTHESSHKSSQSAQSNTTRLPSPAGQQLFVNVKPSIDLLNALIMSNLSTTTVAAFDSRKDAVVAFVDRLDTLSDDDSSSIFSLINSNLSKSLAENCLASPKEFWTFFNLCWTAATKVKASSNAFTQIVNLLENVGKQMVSKDPYVPLALFLDFGLPKMFTVLKRDVSKLPALTRLLYAFSFKDADEHVKVIRMLKEGLDDFVTLVRCLSILISLETNFTDQSLDLYLYYIIAGFKHASSDIRATCVHMLAYVATATDVQGHKHVVNLLEQLEEMTADSWQVKAAVLHCYCALLSVVPARESICSQLYTTVESLIHEKGSPMVARAGFVYLSQCVTAHFRMADAFMYLVNEAPEVSGPVLGLPSPSSPPSSASSSGEEKKTSAARVEWAAQPKLPDYMHRVGVATLVAEYVKQNRCDNLAPPLVKLLALSVQGLKRFSSQDVPKWVEVFKGLGNHLLVEFTDPNFCQEVGKILHLFFLDPSTSEYAKKLMDGDSQNEDDVGPLYGILKLLFAGEQAGNPACQGAVIEFFQRLVADSKSQFTAPILSLLTTFGKHEPDNFDGSILQELADQISE